MKLFFVFLFIVVQPLYPVFEYDKAINKALQGDANTASNDLKRLVINNPDDAQLAYDAGVASYQSADYESALQLFAVASQKASDKQFALKEQSYFNKGNAHLKRNEFGDAINSYEQVLTINKDNQRAQHNLAYAQKMKQQQEQKKSEENKQDSNNQKKNNDERKDNQQKDNQDSSTNDQKNDEQKKQDDRSDGSSQNNKEKQEKQKQQQNNQCDNKQKQNNESNGTSQEGSQDQQHSPKNDMNSPGQQKKEPHGQSASKKQLRQSNELNQSKKKASNDSQQKNGEKKQEDMQQSGDAKEQGVNARHQQDGGLEKKLPSTVTEQSKEDKHMRWINQLLAEQEKADQHLNKLLIQSAVDKQSKGETHEENSW